jgi:hypothetical protein
MGHKKPQPIPPGMERPPGLPTSPPPPKVGRQCRGYNPPATSPCPDPPPLVSVKPDILLRIYRDAAKPIDISGFATVQQAIEQGEQWQGRLWWRVTMGGRTVAEEPLGVKR